jgi:hypothetical protein
MACSKWLVQSKCVVELSNVQNGIFLTNFSSKKKPWFLVMWLRKNVIKIVNDMHIYFFQYYERLIQCFNYLNACNSTYICDLQQINKFVFFTRRKKK